MEENEYLVRKYLKIIKDGKEYTFDEYVSKFKTEIDLYNRDNQDYFCGLPHDIILKYKEKNYTYDEYKSYVDKMCNIGFLPTITLTNEYLQIVYHGLREHQMNARFNLIQAIPFFLDSFECDWETKDTYIGMYGIRSIYVINSVVSHNHILDKLWGFLYLTLMRENIKKEDFLEILKKVNKNLTEKEYNDKIVNNTIQGIKKEFYEEFYKGIQKLDNISKKYNIHEIANHFKHRGLLIEKGMKYNMWRTIQQNNGYIFTSDAIYDDKDYGFLEYDLEEVIEGMYELETELIDFINKEKRSGLINELQIAFGSPNGYDFTK